ncbi:lycopene cyclase domain-containing protein [Microbacterium oleivorans]|uniref:lycopene cyclase domain-containing protein n=1 Tax=Microbacterium oleivorans TaxID=273677 RepID=UPI00080E424E|nr:lycopene cyclase domain-containing protein [Microbacterium oleivorans]
MPGVYLGALIVSALGVLAVDLRHRLALGSAPGRTALLIGCGTVFLLVWDLVGIATGVFVRGDSPLLIGIDLAPHLPLEEPVFLAFLCHLALVIHAIVTRVRAARGRPRGPETT